MASQSPATRMFVQQLTNTKGNTKAPHHWLLALCIGIQDKRILSQGVRDPDRKHLYVMTPSYDGTHCRSRPESCHSCMGHVTLVAITGTTNIIPYLKVKPLQVVWHCSSFGCSHGFHLRVPDLQVTTTHLDESVPGQHLQPGISSDGCHATCAVEQFHKSQNASIPYPTMLHSEQKCAYSLFWMEHYGIWNRCILGCTFLFWTEHRGIWNKSIMGLWIRSIGRTDRMEHSQK